MKTFLLIFACCILDSFQANTQYLLGYRNEYHNYIYGIFVTDYMTPHVNDLVYIYGATVVNRVNTYSYYGSYDDTYGIVAYIEGDKCGVLDIKHRNFIGEYKLYSVKKLKIKKLLKTE